MFTKQEKDNIDLITNSINKKKKSNESRFKKDTVSFALRTVLKNIDLLDLEVVNNALKGMNGHLKGDRKELLIVTLREIVS